MQRIGLAINKEDYEALRFIAFNERTSISELVRTAIENYLKQKEMEKE